MLNKVRIAALASTLCACAAFGQNAINGGRTITGVLDASGAAATKPMKAGTTLPATCSVGELFNKTNATATAVIYACIATDTWTQQGGGVTGAGGAILFSVDGGSQPITAGWTRCVTTSYAGTISGWSITTSGTSSVQFGVWKSAFGASNPTIANSIVASAPPAITSAVTGTSTTLTGWTTAISANDLVCATVTSATGAIWANLKIQVTR